MPGATGGVPARSTFPSRCLPVGLHLDLFLARTHRGGALWRIRRRGEGALLGPAACLAGMLALLDDRFRLLTGGSRTAPERHQTLRAAAGRRSAP